MRPTPLQDLLRLRPLWERNGSEVFLFLRLNPHQKTLDMKGATDRRKRDMALSYVKMSIDQLSSPADMNLGEPRIVWKRISDLYQFVSETITSTKQTDQQSDMESVAQINQKVSWTSLEQLVIVCKTWNWNAIYLKFLERSYLWQDRF